MRMFPAVPPFRTLFGIIPVYSLMILAGIVTAFFLCCKEEKRLGLKPDTVIDLAFLVLPMGILGARAYYVLFNWGVFADDPVSILYIWQGGLAIYGGVIGGLMAILLFARLRRMNPLILTDMIVPTLALAQAIGRWGNYFNMEAYGAAITNPAWQFFPAGVLIPDASGAYTWHMATFFYESVWNVTVFAVLWFVIRQRKKHHGVVTLWYALLYGTGRAIIEGLRTDSLMVGAFRVSQLLSLTLALSAGVVLLILAICDRKNREA